MQLKNGYYILDGNQVFKSLIGPKGLILVSIIVVTIWFRQGLLFAGAEEQLSFYNFTRTLNLFSYPWQKVGTGFPTLLSLPRLPYFFVFESLYRFGISSVVLEAITFFLIIASGMLSVYYLIKYTLEEIIIDKNSRLIPFLGALFFLLNPFSMTQIWGRLLAYQLFTFALVPSFLLFFILCIKKRNLIYLIPGLFVSLLFSGAYASPASVVSSWSTIGLFIIFYIYKERNNLRNIFFSILAFALFILTWVLLHFFWIYPLIKNGKELLNTSLSVSDSIGSLKALAVNSHLLNVLRLVHRQYYDGTYGGFSGNLIITLISILLPIIFLFSLPTFKKVKYFGFYLILFLVSVFITIGANPPTGWFLIWLFEKIPLLQVLRNPYEKFGVNLMLAYAPFFAIGLLVFSRKLASFYKSPKIFFINVFILVILLNGILVWPMWSGNFAGGVMTNFWVEIPNYYKQANNWLNSQKGDFNILQLPLIPEDGITYTWRHPYEGIEPSEFLFDRPSIARNFVFNKDYYSALEDHFGENTDYKKLPNYSTNNTDFNNLNLVKELASLNIRYVVLHFDTDYSKRRAKSPEATRAYLLSQGIKKVNQFGKLEIYKVNIPNDIRLIYSPDAQVSYVKINPTDYVVDVKKAKGLVNLYFLQQFHPSWQAYINGEKINNHTKVFSYANKWSVNKAGSYQVNIRFTQQDSVELGAKTSLISAASIGLLYLLYFLSKIREVFE